MVDTAWNPPRHGGRISRAVGILDWKLRSSMRPARKPISQEFFCHSNLTFAERSGRTPAKYNQEMGGKTHLDWRLFTLVPGPTLPLSFRKASVFLSRPMPPLDYVTMSLNLNERDHVVNVQHADHGAHVSRRDQPGAPTKGACFVVRSTFCSLNGVSAKMGPACMAKAGMHMGAGCAELSKVNMSVKSRLRTNLAMV